MSSTKFCDFRLHQKDKTVRLSWSLIGWDIFDFSSETAARYSMKLDRQQDLNLNVLFQVCVFFSSEIAEQDSMKVDRKQDINILYQVCVYQADQKNKMAARPLIGWDIFDFSS